MRILTILLVLGVLITLLAWRFPYALSSSDAQMSLVYLVILLVAMMAGTRSVSWRELPNIAKQAGLWLLVFVALIIGYSYRGDIAQSRFMAELFPNQIQQTEAGTYTVRASEGGHFFIEATVNGAAVNFMVDTGATDIVLSPDDAKRAGFAANMLSFTQIYNTANGTGLGAPVEIQTLAVGDIVLRNIRASVNKAPMNSSLLGMRFLNELSGYKVEGNTLTLTP